MATPSSAEQAYWQAHSTDDKVPIIILADVLCLFGALLAVVLRFVARSLMKSPLRADDWMIVIGLVSYPTVSHLLNLTFAQGFHGGRRSLPSTPYSRWVRTPRQLYP